ncbi:polysaccharide export protein [Albimonas sp. CAU 1670]|uniref:polysaccharide biosynthesis/export family protein n=1 Tax=Albimonas sp. CAU 1670 TaxID=3032599 RepID=UPI0023DB6E74|nr:polysaccharide biosynthesis/export family protein [Albimonas sp. CAU 1670]MDF2233868.1 polysaccharide export protein [Albimonas sp. CAU 1670]
MRGREAGRGDDAATARHGLRAVGGRRRGLRMLGAGLLAAALAGCAAAPASGPSGDAVRSAAADPQATVAPYAYTILTPEVIELLERSRAEPPADLAGRGAEDAQVFRVGDIVGITIWEAVEGGLFSTQNSESRGAALPVQRISPDGQISVPYAGRIRAAGRTPEAVGDAIVRALAGKAIEPQVIVTIDQSPVSTVTVLGDAIGKPGRVKLNGVGERVLDVIAASGGSKPPAHRTLIRLTRGDVQAEAHLARILREPAQNVRVRSGDVIAALDIGQSFTALGAAGRPRRIAFSTEVVTLDQAIAEAGGLDDNRADPRSVFVFRYENPEVAMALAGPSAAPAPGTALSPIVYGLDLSDPGSFFLARRFAMEDGDIVYTANSDLAQAGKVLQVVDKALSPTTQTLRLLNTLD